jgi:hypothetical protein
MRLSPLTISRPCGRPHSDIIIDAYRPFAHVAMCIYFAKRYARGQPGGGRVTCWNSEAALTCLIAPTALAQY